MACRCASERGRALLIEMSLAWCSGEIFLFCDLNMALSRARNSGVKAAFCLAACSGLTFLPKDGWVSPLPVPFPPGAVLTRLNPSSR